MAKDSRRRSEFSGDIVKFGFEFSSFSMTQSFLAQTAEIMIEEKVEFPRELGFIEGQPTGDRLELISLISSSLNFRNQLDRLLSILLTLILVFLIVRLKQLLITEVFLDDDSGRPVDCEYLRNWNIRLDKQPSHVEVWMKFGVERLRINGRDRLALLPGDTEILAS